MNTHFFSYTEGAKRYNFGITRELTGLLQLKPFAWNAQQPVQFPVDPFRTRVLPARWIGQCPSLRREHFKQLRLGYRKIATLTGIELHDHPVGGFCE